jgi:hypothetical protein
MPGRLVRLAHAEQVFINSTGAPAGFITPAKANVTFFGDIVAFVVQACGSVCVVHHRTRGALCLIRRKCSGVLSWTQPNGTLFEAFVLTGHTTATGDISLKYNSTSQQTLVYGNLTTVHIQTTIAKSNVGWFPVSALDLALNTLGELFMLPMLNR